MITCPLCESQTPVSQQTFQAGKIIEKWQQAFGIDISVEFGGVDVLQLLDCPNCKLQFFEPASLAGSPTLYERLQKFEWYYMREKWEHQLALDDLASCQNGIEVGCGSGEFVARVLHDKPWIAFEGYEQSPSAVETARSKGLPVHLVDFKELAESRPGQYAAVCAFQVLEHLADPRSFLLAACRLLSPGGKMILGLPNARSFLRYQFNLLDMPPHHITRWTSHTFKQVERHFPLEIRKLSYEPLADYHIEAYVEGYTNLLSHVGVSIATAPAVRSRLALLLRWSSLQRFLRGQSIYVCYERT